MKSFTHAPPVIGSGAPELSRDDYRLLVESVEDYAIFMLDREGHVASWNLGAEKIKGYRADEIIGQHFSRFYPAEDIASGRPLRLLAAARDHGHAEDEGWRLRKDGTPFWANVVVTALRRETGELRGFAKVTRDLTQRRLVAENLRHAEERFHHLVDAVTDYAIYMLDPTGQVSTWNAGANKLKGYTADEIIGQHFSVFYTPEDQAAGAPARVLETVRSQGRYEEEGWRVRKDGTRFWAHVVVTALRDASGVVLGFAKVTRDLSDRRRAEEELRRSEERFRLLVENVTDYAIYMITPSGQVATWNLGAERMKGYRPDEIIGRNFAQFFAEDDVRTGKPKRELEIARVQGRFEEEGWRQRKDGSRFWANVTLTAVHDAHGDLIGFAKVTRDLTARRQAEQNEHRLVREQAARAAAEEGERRLGESEERYRALSNRLEIILEGVADGITVQDRSGRVTYANNAAARIFGFASVKELLEVSAAEAAERFQILDEGGLPFVADDLPGRRALRGERDASAVYHVRERSSGREWWSRVRASAVVGADGRPELAVNVWHDITAERRQQLESRWVDAATAVLTKSLDQEQMLQAFASVLVPGLADWCSIRLLDGNRLRSVAVAHADAGKLPIARQYAQGHARDAGPAGGHWSVLRSGQAELHNEITDAMLAREANGPAELELLRGLGMQSVLIVPIHSRNRVIGTMALVCAESGRRFDSHDVELVTELGRRAGTAVDNAQLYMAAHEAAKAAEEAAQNAETANRLKDEFLATVSHELRTPLNAIVGWSSMLRRRELDPGVAKGVEVIDRNARAQVKIIEDILDVSRIISGKLRLEVKSTDLAVVVRDAIEVVRPSATAKRIEIELAPADDLSLLLIDPERIQQVIWNLLSNAVKFTEPGGSIRIAVWQQGSNVVLAVADTGSGIDPEFVPYVFDRFKQADGSTTRRFGGLGLGLALVRHIVELHGGSVSAESAGRHKGATFTIVLPIRAVARETPHAAPATAPRPLQPLPAGEGLQGLRVLVVDDDDDAREVLTEVLVEAGAVVETAASVRDGLEAVQRFRPQVLVSDIGMPDEDGYSFVRRVRALAPAEGGGIPSIALTAYTRSDDRTRALAAGFTTHVGKPVNPEALVAAVANLAVFARR